MRGRGDKLAVFGKDGMVRIIDGETGKEADSYDSTTRKASGTPLYENEQLVQLIIAQRNFQANARTISTADEITQTIINI